MAAAVICDALALQNVPTMDGMYWLNLLSRILHMLGAIVLVGGIFYVWAVVMPSPAAQNATTVDQKFGGLRSKWAMWIGIATLLLLVSGLWNFVYMVRMYELGGSYHMVFGLKFLAALAVFLLAALVAGRSTAAEVLRSNMRRWVAVCLILGVLTVALGSLLRSYPHERKLDAPSTPAPVAPQAAGGVE